MTPVERRILIKVSTMYYLEHMNKQKLQDGLELSVRLLANISNVLSTRVLSRLPLPMKVLRILSRLWKNVSG